MTHKKNDTQERNESQETFEAMLREKFGTGGANRIGECVTRNSPLRLVSAVSFTKWTMCSTKFRANSGSKLSRN